MDIAAKINGVARKVPAWTIYIVGAAWAVYLFYLAAFTRAFGAEPINALEREYGEIGLQLLVLGLLITPLRSWFGVNLIKFRRAIGLITFYYITCHLLVWLVLDVQILSQIWADILKRPYITVGMVGFALLVPLALTSNNRSIRKLGPLRWRRLHQASYAAALLGAVHWIMLERGWQLEPMIYLALIVGLLLARVPLPMKRAAA